jgi:hypothetical protein
MARAPLPRSNFGTSSLVERRNDIPTVDLEEGSGAEVDVQEDVVLEAPGLNIELEEDGSVVVDFDPRPEAQDGGMTPTRMAARIGKMLIARVWSF